MCGGNSGVHVMQNYSELTSKLWMEMPSKEAPMHKQPNRNINLTMIFEIPLHIAQASPS
jgi:hypothetical protein